MISGRDLCELHPGIISVIQTPFDLQDSLDLESLERLVEATIAGGVSGFLVPAVASEVSFLHPEERDLIVKHVANIVKARVPIIVGASDPQPGNCIQQAHLGHSVGAVAYLVAVPMNLYGQPKLIEAFFQEIVSATGDFPLMIQDLDFTGPGLDVETIKHLIDILPSLSALKIETIPAGPKYTAIREICGNEIFIAGGWPISQMIEALDRGVDAMIPESSMVQVLCTIDQSYRTGHREEAIQIFNRLQPVLGFSHQNLILSIAFCKRLLVRKGIFTTDQIRIADFKWDQYNDRIASEITEYFLELEASIRSSKIVERSLL